MEEEIEKTTIDGSHIKGSLSVKGVMTFELKYVINSDKEKFKEAITFLKNELNELRKITLLTQ